MARFNIGMGLFILGGFFYPLSIGYGFAIGNWLIAIIGIITGASLITISIVKFLYQEEVDYNG